jgi:hypothetical protein
MLNLADVSRQLTTTAAEMGQYRQNAENATRQALARLRFHADNPAALSGQLALAAQAALDSALRFLCATPAIERIDAAFPLPAGPEKLMVLASDGSQIFPDQHGALLYYLINLGGIIYRHGSGETPRPYHPRPIFTYHPDHLFYPTGDIVTPAEIRSYRDIEELQTLLDMANQYRPFPKKPAFNKTDEPIIALYDGPLRLYVADLPTAALRDQQKIEYQEMLEILRDSGVHTAGYVDRPRSYYVLSMLHLADLPHINEEALEQSPYRFTTDLALFGHILPPGCRSAVFGLVEAESVATAETFFFYLNVGHKEDAPILARVEIPPWLAGDKAAIDLLHYALVRQARIAGGYPYVLARAHELALISKAERDAVETMLYGKLRQAGFKPEVSPKQAQKDLLRGD